MAPGIRGPRGDGLILMYACGRQLRRRSSIMPAAVVIYLFIRSVPSWGMTMEYDHRTASRIHAVKRAWHRFGIAISVGELMGLEKLIWDGKARWIRDQPDLRSVYRLTVRNKTVFV